jgi:anti-anti-sigma regulatory factor
MSASCRLQVGRTHGGYRIRVEGKGTLRESPALQEFAEQALDHGPGTFVLDLSACQHLDSTFLGCLIGLHRRYGLGPAPRFAIAASPQTHRLLAPTRLDSFLNLTEERAEFTGEEVYLPVDSKGSADLGRHIMECHRQLAEVEGPDRVNFQQIADRLAGELGCRQH